MNKPNVIFFDLDDTLTSFDGTSRQAWEVSCDRLIEKYDLAVTRENLLECIVCVKKKYWSDPAKHKWGREHLRQARREVAALALEECGIGDTAMSNEFGDCYTDYQNTLIEPLPGVPEALSRLRDAGFRLAVITNGVAKAQREKLTRFHLTEFFEQVFVDTEVGYSKPDVRIYEYALTKMNVQASDAWMIGDNLNWDVQGAQDAGLYAVWNDYSGKGVTACGGVHPDLIVPSVAEMANELLK